MRFKKLLKKIINRLFKIFLVKKTLRINNLDSIEIAINKMTEHIDKNALKIDEILKK